MAVELTLHAKERSTYVVRVSFTDEDGDPVIPTAATWTLTDTDGTVINSREDVVIGSLATSVDIVLSGADLAITEPVNVLRLLAVEGTYNSTLGSGLPLKDEIRFYVDNIKAVS